MINVMNFDLLQVRQHRKLQLNELEEWRTGAYKSFRLYKEEVKGYHDKRIERDKKFEKEDEMLLFNLRLRLFLGILK